VSADSEATAPVPISAPTWLILSKHDRMAGGGAAGGAGVVIAGAAGCGRSVLARAVLDRLAARGAETVWAVASRSSAAVPLGALARLLPEEAGAGCGADAISAIMRIAKTGLRRHGVEDLERGASQASRARRGQSSR
jgi:hypothetical protein